MVDNPKQTEDQLKSLQDATKKAEADANAFGDVFAKVFNGISQGAQNAAKFMETVGEEIQDISKSLTVMGASADFKTLQAPLDQILNSFGKLATVVDSSRFFDQFADNSGSAINTVTGNLDVLQKAMTALHIPGAAAITGLAEGFIQNANQGEKLENSFIALSAAGGDMSEVFKGQGGELQDLTALTTAYMNTVGDAADVTGLSIKQSSEFANALKQIPGAMNETITFGGKLEDTNSALVESMKIMTGTGQSQNTVMGVLSKAYDDLSTSQGRVSDSTQKGSELLATMSSVSTGLKLRFEDVKNTMEQVADQFKFIGNETDATARTLGRYTDALRETGLTGKASLEITQQMISNMSEMTTGTKAFLSLRAGGPGGLQGAAQIDQMLREGKLDQVTQMAERSLKQQFGGKIYTQAEATQSQEAAAGFTRQKQLLGSGAFGIGKGMDDAKLTRLLEALGKGDIGGATKELKTGQDALASVTKQGTDIQERNNTELKAANRGIERSAIANEVTALAMMRVGVGSLGAARGDLQAQTGNARTIGQSQELKRQNMGAYGTASGMGDEQMAILRRQMAGNLADSARGGMHGAAQAPVGAKDIASEAINGMQKFVKETNMKTPVTQHIQLNTRGQDVYNHAMKTAPPTHMAQAALKTTQHEATAPGHATAPAAQKADAQVIRLEISHAKDLNVTKKTDNSIGSFNAASAGITTTKIDWGY